MSKSRKWERECVYEEEGMKRKKKHNTRSMRMCLSAHLRRVLYARAHTMLGRNTRGY